MGNQFALQRFVTPLNQLNALLEKGRYQKDKAVGLYNNDGRTLVFRLEALCRIYRDIHDKKFFKEWYRKFKVLEDALGNMDYNESMHKEFSAYKELKKVSEENFKAHLDESAVYVTNMLKNDGWLSGDAIREFVDGLNSLDWLDAEEDRVAYANVICDELDKLVIKYGNGEINPHELEEGLHEFRRRLRWVSIYAQVSDGLVQITPVKNVPNDVLKYCTDDIISSPFNALPKAQKNQHTLTIQSHYFYAMSWLIQYTGELKDIGQRYEAFKELTKQAGLRNVNVNKQFLASCKHAPTDISSLAEAAIDEFIYRDFIPERICRDFMRSI